LESGLANRFHCRQRGLRFTVDAQAALAELEAQAEHTRDALDRVADLGLLARAVHGRNAKSLAAGRFR
jgi:hypothetical protein